MDQQQTLCETARKILLEAQRMLTQRLAERVANSQREILNDAQGESYLSEIGVIYEEVAGRLVHVHQMLNCLPGASQTGHSRAGCLSRWSAEEFTTFIGQVREGNLDAASESLADLLRLDLARAIRCVEYFQTQLHQRPNFLAEAIQFRVAVDSGGVNDCLFGLTTCFGLHGDDLVRAFEGVRGRLSVA